MGVLAINAGSATVKAAWFPQADAPAAWRMHVDLVRGAWTASDGRHGPAISPGEPGAGVALVLDAFQRVGGGPPSRLAHRVVHGGGRFDRPVVLGDDVIAALAGLAPLAPLHQPASLAAIATARARFPQALHVACFDTAFHARWPDAARRFALPRRLHEQGIRRYGFHGLAHGWAARVLRATVPQARRAVVAHLGGGSSLCALLDFASIDASMGFSPLDGLPMATRCGALDPGVVLELVGARGMPVQAVEHLLYRESGLLGVSGLSGDLRDLLASKAPEAGEAVDLYVHHVARGIGAMAVTLGGLDALVFSGGIGENAPAIRAAVCQRLAFLGVALDAARNLAGDPVLEADGAAVAVRIVACDEEAEMAREATVVAPARPSS
jgi:acetate kinase